MREAKRKSVSTFFSLAIILAFFGGQVAWAQQVKTVIAEGRSAAQDAARAFDEARADAMREAVNQAAGVYVQSDTLTKNFRLIADLVQTKSAGLIRSYEVVSRGRQDEFYVVKIKAEVVMTQLRKDLEAIGLLQKITGGQRIMVLGVERIDGAISETNFVQQPLEEALLAKGFDLVDKSQFDAITARDAVQNLNDPAAATALANRFGAEILLTYNAAASYAGEQTQYGVTNHFYSAETTLKIIKVDTARIRSSLSSSARLGGPAKQSAANQTLARCGKDIAEQSVEGIVDLLQREFLGAGADLELVVSKIDFVNMTKLKSALEKIRGVTSVGSPTIQNQLAIFRLKATMQAEALAKILAELEGFPLEITGLQQNRVEAEWKK